MGTAPENTLAAFERARAAGADAFECDVRITADNHVVVCHDSTLDRTTDGVGVIEQMDLASIQRWNAAALWSSFAPQRVPLLSDLLQMFSDVALIVELKTESVARAAVNVVHKAGAAQRVIFGAFDENALGAPRAAGLHTLASKNEIVHLLKRAVRGLPPEPVPYAAISLSPSYYRIPLPLGRLSRASSVPLHVWTVNDSRKAAQYWGRGARGIISDYPEVMLEARGKLK